MAVVISIALHQDLCKPDICHLTAILQMLELECQQLRQSSAEAAGETAEERKLGVAKERKLMDRTHEAAKLREQLLEAEVSHQANMLSSGHHSLSCQGEYCQHSSIPTCMLTSVRHYKPLSMALFGVVKVTRASAQVR